MLVVKSDLPPARMRRSGALVILAGIFVLLGTSLLVMEKGDLITRVAASAVILLSTGLLIGRLRTIPEATSASDRLAEINRDLEEELQRTRDQHRQLDHYFEMLMANVPANIYFKDRDSRFLRVNQSMATYVRKGHPRDLIGKTDHDLFGPEHADPARADEMRIISNGTAITGLVEREVFPDGSTGWVLTNKMPFRDRDGNIIGTFGMSSDVSELVNAKQELERERYLLRSLIDAFPDKIFARDLDRHYLVVNRAMAEWVGADSPEEMIGKTPADYFPEIIVTAGKAEDLRIIENRQGVLNREWDLEWEPGDIHHFVTSKVPLFDADGKVWGIVGMDRDVTEERRAKDQVIQAEQRMQAMIDNSPAVIAMKDLDGRYLMVNRGFEALFGLARKDVLGFTDHQLIADKAAADKFRKHDQLVAEQGEALQMDEELFVDNEPRTYVSVKFPLRDLTGNIQSIGSIATDITDRKAAERAMHLLNEDLVKANEDLKRAQEQLIQAEKMESIGRLAAGVAHEVKNPLAMIGMGIELLGRRVPTEDKQGQETIERMKRGIDRAKKIVKGLVDYSSARQLSVEPKDIAEVISDSLALVDYPLRQAKIELFKEIEPNLPQVGVDATKMEQVLVNLMINAMHAMPKGGTLTVRAFARSLGGVRRDEGMRTASHLRAGDHVIRIEIDDSGSGIDEAIMSKIFDPFFTTKATGQGTGLGLAVCRKIIELHNGVLELENRPGGGVRASVTLKVS